MPIGVDGAIIAQHSLNRITLLATARAFSHAYDADSMRFAVAGGALVHLSRFIAIGGDVGSLIDRSASEKLAWSGALQLAIPSTPHSLSIQISNANTATLEGASRGEVGHRYGFEFTIPLHFSRFKSAATQTFPDGATRVVMKNIAFEPGHISIARGTTVAWRNEDQLAHTVTAVDHSWTSPLLPPGAVYTHSFDQPGRYEITCTPHPSMKLIVEVM